MMPDPTFNAIEAKRRIADAQAIATAERLVRGTSLRPDGPRRPGRDRRRVPPPRPRASAPASPRSRRHRRQPRDRPAAGGSAG